MYHSLNGLKRRSKYLGEVDKAFSIFEENQEGLKLCFENLWVDLKGYAKNVYNEK
ncbi:MAG: hypothetical protein E6Q95_01365 [Chitinophagaceae bacterium]|nr:MAG: hypothetical protein E6Q95_01365 [Chitinophagaceae bacterium]